MNLVAVTTRRIHSSGFVEERDALDARWFAFFERCQILPLILPNHLATASKLVEAMKPKGFLFTGGGELGRYGGDCPQRDEVERWCLDKALTDCLPVIGVARGMQAIQDFFGTDLEKVRGHVEHAQVVWIDGIPHKVNSNHSFGTSSINPELDAWAFAEDNLVKAVRHREWPITGIMWNPEQIAPFADRDLALFKSKFA